MTRPEAAPHASQLPQSRHFLVAMAALLVLTAGLRSVALNRPLLGNFATKNVVYGMIARNWVAGNADILHPTLDVLVGGRRSLVMVEWPVSAYLTAGLWGLFGGSLDVWGRATAVAFSVASVAVMFGFVRRRHGPIAAWAAAAALAMAPAGIIYGQSFMLEASLVLCTLGTFDAAERRLAGGRFPWLIVAGVCLALLLLTKIYMLVVLLPLGVMFLRSPRAASGQSWAALVVVTTLAVLPAAAWYGFAYQVTSPDGPHAEQIFYSVRQSAEVHRPPHPLLWSPDFYRQLLDDLTGVVLTPIGFVLALAGLLDRRWRQHAPWLAAMLLLVLALPRKFHEMNYYFMAVLPPLCVMVGLGWQVVWRRLRLGRVAQVLLVLTAMVLALRYAVRPAFVTPEEDRGVLAAAEAIRGLTGEDEPVVTAHGTGIDLLYYCRRPGWAVDWNTDPDTWAATLEDCRRQGARYLVVVGEGPAAGSLVAWGDNYRIHRLTAR